MVTGTTDAEGRYRIGGLPKAVAGGRPVCPSVWAMTADRLLRVSDTWMHNELSADRYPPLFLVGRCALQGTVVDDAGIPVGRARVKIASVGGPMPTMDELMHGKQFLSPNPQLYEGYATTDDRGTFRIDRLQPGPLEYFAVTAPGRGFVGASTEEEMRKMLGHDALIANDQVLNLHIVMHRGRSLSATVIGPGGAPIEGARIRVRGGALSLFEALLATRSDGAFRLDGLPWVKPSLGPDAYLSLAVDAPGWVAADAKGARVRVPQGNGPNLAAAVRMVEGVAVEGRVLDRASTPVANARVYFVRKDVVADTDDSFVEVRTGRDGSFLAPSLLAGEYRVSATSPYVEGEASGVVKTAPDGAKTSGVELRFASTLPPAPGSK